jgi:hypothetical protein
VTFWEENFATLADYQKAVGLSLRAFWEDEFKSIGDYRRAAAGRVGLRKGTALVGYVDKSKKNEHCLECHAFDIDTGICTNAKVQEDPDVPTNARGQKYVNPLGWCKEFEATVAVVDGTEEQ